MGKKTLSFLLTAAFIMALFGVLPLTADATSEETPYATEVGITGDLIAGHTISGEYTYNSDLSTPEGETSFRWLKSGEPSELYTNYTYSEPFLSGPTEDTVITLSEDTYLTELKTYHLNDYNGAEPGTISLLDGNGDVYRTWEADRAYSYTNFYWKVNPNEVIPAGTYTVTVSEPATWSYNVESGNQGFVWVTGSGLTVIDGETAQSYEISDSDYQDVLGLEVTVKDNLGNAGDPVRAYSEPVIAYWGDLITETGQYPFAGGDGSADDPYLIATPYQLAQLAFDVAQDIGYSGEYFQLVDDIDLSGLHWNPIGASATEEFMGYLDGNNYVVSNMSIGSVDVPVILEEAGLFGYVQGATIHNLVVDNASIYIDMGEEDDDCAVGVLAGEVNGSFIYSCRVAGEINSVTPDGAYAGGLVGKMDYYCQGIVACFADVDITVTGYSYSDVGGLVGEAYCPITASRASGSVGGSGYLGGLAGESTSSVLDCYATGNVSSSYIAGGLVGDNSGTVLNSYATGTVYGHDYAGGLAGFHDYSNWIKNSYAKGNVSAGYASGEAGGLVGSSCGSIQNSYAAGQVTYGQGLLDSLFLGFGSEPAASATDCYWNADLNATGGAGTGKTEAEMQAVGFADLLNGTEITGREDSWRQWQIISGVNNGMPVLDGVGEGMEFAPAVITETVGVHNLAADAEISFTSDCLGEFYYEFVTPGEEAPVAIDTQGSGILCYKGENDYTLPATTGAWDIYITVKNLSGAVSTPVKIELAAEPALFAGGTGTSMDPYQVASAYHLHNVRYYPDSYFILTEDIDLDPALIGDAFWYDAVKGWEPIGRDYNSPFNGFLDGNGKTIFNMHIGSAETPEASLPYPGLFGYVNTSSTIKNLHVSAFAIYSGMGGAAIGGVAGGLQGTIDHCSASGSIAAYYGNIGGLVGANYTDALIKNSHADVAIQTGSWGYTGGLVGSNQGYIYNCCATGDIQSESYARTGGLTGYNYAYGSSPSIINCYATGNVSASGWGYLGPFYGENNVATAFADCYWNADAVISATSADGYTPTVHGSTAECQSLASADMKASSFVDTLNTGLPDSIGYYGWEIAPGVNDGYPVLMAEAGWDVTPPTVANDVITASDITKNGVILAWEEATDDITDSQDLLYRLYRSSSDNLNTVTAIESNGTPVTSYDYIDMYSVNDLAAATTYYFNVIAKDEAGNKSAYAVRSVTTISGGGGGGGGGSVTPVIQVATEQTNGVTNNTTELSATISAGTASVNASTPVIEALINKARQTDGICSEDNMEITVNTQGSINELKVNIAQSNLANIVQNTDASLTLSSPFITVSFNDKALDTIAAAASGGTVVISAGLVDSDVLSDADKAKVGGRPVYDFSVRNGGTQVTDFAGGQATVSIPYTLQPDEDPDSIVVYYLADDGSLQVVRGYYDALAKAVIFKTNHFSGFVIGYNQVTFRDVPAAAWYKNAVDFIAARGITKGIDADNYGPNAQLTRGQFVVLLLNAYNISPERKVEFKDITPFADAGDTYYTDYLLVAKGLGIVNGLGNNLFAPQKEITRQEMFVMLYNALKVIGETPDQVVAKRLADFSDAGQAASWAGEALDALIEGGIVSGNDNLIGPTDKTTRAQIAQVLYNLLAK